MVRTGGVVILTFRPIGTMPADWSPANAERPASPFDSTYTQTMNLLDRELSHLGATDQFLQVEAGTNGVRVDGQLRANAVVTHPGVILTIETKSMGTLVYDTDKYGRRAWERNANPAWQENLRAIALGLEALRKVERYGIAKRGQQYAGYAQLGAGIPLGPGEVAPMSVDTARQVLADGAGWSGSDVPHSLADRNVWESAYRQAVKRHHPDTGGDAETFRLITEARDVLAAKP
jgi:hypothetical protein